MMNKEIQQFDELMELWDEEGQPDDVDWLAHAQNFRNRVQQLKAKLGECRKLALTPSH